jgi:hypothetical protein
VVDASLFIDLSDVGRVVHRYIDLKLVSFDLVAASILRLPDRLHAPEWLDSAGRRLHTKDTPIARSIRRRGHVRDLVGLRWPGEPIRWLALDASPDMKNQFVLTGFRDVTERINRMTPPLGPDDTQPIVPIRKVDPEDPRANANVSCGVAAAGPEIK